ELLAQRQTMPRSIGLAASAAGVRICTVGESAQRVPVLLRRGCRGRDFPETLQPKAPLWGVWHLNPDFRTIARGVCEEIYFPKPGFPRGRSSLANFFRSFSRITYDHPRLSAGMRPSLIYRRTSDSSRSRNSAACLTVKSPGMVLAIDMRPILP